MKTNMQLRELLKVTLIDLPLIQNPPIDFKLVFELYGHPILTLIKQKQSVPITLKVYYAVPSKWILDWKRRYD